MEEHDNRKLGGRPGWPYDVKLQFASIIVNGLFRLLNARQVNLHTLLSVDEDLTRVFAGEFRVVRG